MIVVPIVHIVSEDRRIDVLHGPPAQGGLAYPDVHDEVLRAPSSPVVSVSRTYISSGGRASSVATLNFFGSFGSLSYVLKPSMHRLTDKGD